MYLNTTLQYIDNYQSKLIELIQYKPLYIIFTRLLITNTKTFIVNQNTQGKTTKCIFINFQEIFDIFSNNNYKLIFKSPCIEEVFNSAYDDSIPKHQQIKNSSNIIFERID